MSSIFHIMQMIFYDGGVVVKDCRGCRGVFFSVYSFIVYCLRICSKLELPNPLVPKRFGVMGVLTIGLNAVDAFNETSLYCNDQMIRGVRECLFLQMQKIFAQI